MRYQSNCLPASSGARVHPAAVAAGLEHGRDHAFRDLRRLALRPRLHPAGLGELGRPDDVHRDEVDVAVAGGEATHELLALLARVGRKRFDWIRYRPFDAFAHARAACWNEPPFCGAVYQCKVTGPAAALGPAVQKPAVASAIASPSWTAIPLFVLITRPAYPAPYQPQTHCSSLFVAASGLRGARDRGGGARRRARRLAVVVVLVGGALVDVDVRR